MESKNKKEYLSIFKMDKKDREPLEKIYEAYKRGEIVEKDAKFQIKEYIEQIKDEEGRLIYKQVEELTHNLEDYFNGCSEVTQPCSDTINMVCGMIVIKA